MSRTRAARTIAVGALAVVLAGCDSRTPTTPSPAPVVPTVAIMGPPRLEPMQLVAWFNGRQPRPAGVYAAAVPIETLAALFVEEGTMEGVTGARVPRHVESRTLIPKGIRIPSGATPVRSHDGGAAARRSG